MYTTLTLPKCLNGQEQTILERFKVARDIVRRKSSGIEGATWREVARFGGADAAGIVRNPEAVESVRASVNLADDLFLAYGEATDLVDPVLLHYGCMWLASALVYSKLHKPSELDTVGHGLQIDFGSNNRVLLDACARLKNRGRIQLLSQYLGGSDLSDKSISVLEVIRTIPEMDPFLKEMGEEGTSAIPVHLFDATPGTTDAFFEQCRIQFLTETPLDEEFVKKKLPLFPVFAERGANLVAGSNQLYWKPRGTYHADACTLLMTTAGEEYFAERVTASGLYIPELVAHLIFLHTLSMLARYQPKKWLKMADEYTPEHRLVREFIDISQVKFPILVLNELTKRTYVFE